MELGKGGGGKSNETRGEGERRSKRGKGPKEGRAWKEEKSEGMVKVRTKVEEATEQAEEEHGRD